MSDAGDFYVSSSCIALDPYPIEYIYDEKMISRETGLTVAFPLRVFNLHGLGIDAALFLREVAPSFYTLPWDEYDMKREQLYFLSGVFPDATQRLQKFYDEYYAGSTTLAEVRDLLDAMSPEKQKAFKDIRPYRRRSVAKFHLSKIGQGHWYLERMSVGGFAQSQGGTDERARTRVFAEMDTAVTFHPEFQKLIVRMGEIVESIHHRAEVLEITAHQMGCAARHGKFGDNAPEGTHKDGTHYIVSALVIERRAVEGGVSTVYGEDKKTVYLTRTLRPGEGLFQADQESPFWHDVSPVYLDPKTQAEYGQRNIIGFDIRVL